MELDDATRDELAGFFARRFPTAEARSQLARAAGLVLEPDEEDATAAAAWIALLARADQRGALPQLADAACAAAPEDKMLAEARTLLRGPRVAPAGRSGRGVAFVGAALVLGILGAGVTGALWMSGTGGGARVPPVAEVAPVLSVEAVPVAAAVVPPVEEPPMIEPAVAEPVVNEPVVTPASPMPEPAVVVASPPAEPTPAPSSSSSSSAPTSCRGASGVIVGWWYAGTVSPGAQGATVTLPSSVNVRADYPHRDNGYAMRGRVLCSLSAGTTQRLSNAPVDIGQGHWWVPVAGGDL